MGCKIRPILSLRLVVVRLTRARANRRARRLWERVVLHYKGRPIMIHVFQTREKGFLRVACNVGGERLLTFQCRGSEANTIMDVAIQMLSGFHGSNAVLRVIKRLRFLRRSNTTSNAMLCTVLRCFKRFDIIRTSTLLIRSQGYSGSTLISNVLMINHVRTFPPQL